MVTVAPAEATAVAMEAAAVVLAAAVTACLTLVQVCRSRAGVSSYAAINNLDNHETTVILTSLFTRS